MYSYTSFGLLLAIVYVLLFILKWKVGRHLRHLPTYPYLPILGNMHLLLGVRNGFQRLVEVSDLMEKARLPFIFWAGFHPVIVISDPDDAKVVSNDSIEKPHFYNFARVWLGTGILTAPGYIWRKNIKMLGGSFSHEAVNSYLDTFNKQAKKLVKRLNSHVDGEPFDVMRPLSHATLESICQTALGICEMTNNIVIDDIYQALKNTLEILIQRGFNIFHHPDFIYKRTRAYKELNEYVAILHNMSDIVLKKRKQNRSIQDSKYNQRGKFVHGTSSQTTAGSLDEIVRPGFKAYLDILLDMSTMDSSLTEQQIQSEVDTVIFAGQETVATTLFFILSVIGSKRDIQEKLFFECKKIFGDTKRDVLKDDLDRMIYCEAVINETLRLYPPAPVILRKSERNLKLKSCTVPKGATCVLNAWGSGRSRRLWGSDALDFHPERWSVSTPPLIAFSIGRRACIGKKYAMAILKIFLAHCIQELIFISDVEKMELKIDVTLSANKGNLLQVKLRDGK